MEQKPLVETTFAPAMKNYFGFLPGQTFQQFMEELRALSPEDRTWLAKNLETVGFKIIGIFNK